MKKEFTVKSIWKESAIFASFLLLAACMQYDESLSPKSDGVASESLTAESMNDQAAMPQRNFTAHLNAANEVNPNGVDSQGQGQAIFKLSKDGTELYYKLIVANIDRITAAHIHCGAAGVNGPVVAFLFGNVPGGVTQNGILAEGVITTANIITRPDSPACAGGLSTFEGLIERMRNGTAYVNAHTPDYPGGEIRGQIK